MSILGKTGVGVAIAATLLTAAAPGQAQDRHGWRGGHHGRGDRNVAGAVLGGILGLGVGAAIASSARDRDRGYDGPPPPPAYPQSYDGRPYAPGDARLSGGDPWASSAGYSAGGVVYGRPGYDGRGDPYADGRYPNGNR